jgi:hypothetical protein
MTAEEASKKLTFRNENTHKKLAPPIRKELF